MKKLIQHNAFFLALLLGVLFAFPRYGTAQSDKSNENLTRARNNFNVGNFEEALEDLEYLVGSKDKQDRREAFELQAEIYLAQGKREQADTAMKNLLKNHWGYQADARNPDLYHLWRTFRTEPVMYLSGRLGANQTAVVTYANYGAGNTQTQSAVFSDDFSSFHFGAGLSFALNRNLTLGLELLFMKRDFDYEETLNTGSLQQPSLVHRLSLRENHTWIDLPVLATYTFPIKRRDGSPWIFYPALSAGLNFGYLQDAQFEGLKRVSSGSPEEEAFIVEAPAVNLLQGNSLRKQFRMSLVGGVGARFPIRNDFFELGFRYQFGFQNLVDAENRYARSDLVYKFGYVDDDMRLENYEISLSYIWAIYLPGKKKKYRRPDYRPDPYPRRIDSVSTRFARDQEVLEEEVPVERYSIREIEVLLQNAIESIEDLDSLESVLVRELEHLRRVRSEREAEASATVEQRLDELEALIEYELKLLAKEKKRLKESLREGHLDQIDEEIEALRKIRDDLEKRRQELKEEVEKK